MGLAATLDVLAGREKGPGAAAALERAVTAVRTAIQPHSVFEEGL